MEVSVEVQKIMLYRVLFFFPSGGGVDDFINQWGVEVVINQTNCQECNFDVHCIQCQAFSESWISLSNMSRAIPNMYTYPFNSQLVINHDKKPKDQRNSVYCRE